MEGNPGIDIVTLRIGASLKKSRAFVMIYGVKFHESSQVAFLVGAGEDRKIQWQFIEGLIEFIKGDSSNREEFLGFGRHFEQKGKEERIF